MEEVASPAAIHTSSWSEPEVRGLDFKTQGICNPKVERPHGPESP